MPKRLQFEKLATRNSQLVTRLTMFSIDLSKLVCKLACFIYIKGRQNYLVSRLT